MTLGKTLTASALLHLTVLFLAGMSFTFRAGIQPVEKVLFVSLREDTVGTNLKKGALEKTAPAGPYKAPEPLNASSPEEKAIIHIETPEKSILFTLPKPLPSREGMERGGLSSREGVIYQPSPPAGEGKGEGEIREGEAVSELTLKKIRDSILKATAYPPYARQRKLEGSVLAGFLIDPGGLPGDIRILKSSGHKPLDNEVVRIIKRASPYPPFGERVEVPISFRLSEESETP